MKRLVLAIALSVSMVGCSPATYQVHPGAGGYTTGTPTASQIFDSQEYDALVAANTIIQGVQADYMAGKFPASAMPTIKTAANAATTAYNIAQAQWMEFDASLKSGGTPSQSALLSAVAAMNTAVSQLSAAKGTL
jgi:hypothetical protein